MITTIINLIFTIIYPIFGTLLVIVNLFEQMFRGFAGVGDIYFGTNGIGGSFNWADKVTSSNVGGSSNTGILYYLLNSDVVKDLLISIALLGLFLIIIFTAMAFIKNMYAEKPKSWQDIISSSLKGLMNFIFLPVCCLLGVWGGNILLNAIDGATNTGQTTSFAGKIFIAASYDANRIRQNDISPGIVALGNTTDATLLDQQFMELMADNPAGYMWYSTVSPYYKLADINYLILGVGAVFTITVLIALTYGVIKRLFILLMLYVISPALCALYPLDDGNAAKAWKKDFTKNVLSAYSAIAGMNIYFSVAPLISKIKIIPIDPTGILDSMVQIILLIVGLYCVKEFIGLIAGYIGAGNALSDGEGMRSKVQGASKKYVGKTVKGGIRAGQFVYTTASNVKRGIFGEGKANRLRRKARRADIKEFKNSGDALKGFEWDYSASYEDNLQRKDAWERDLVRQKKRELRANDRQKKNQERKEGWSNFGENVGEVALDAWNFVNKKVADSTGLKSKDVNRYNFKNKWKENNVLGQILYESSDKDKENKIKRDEAALKKEKKGYLKQIKGLTKGDEMVADPDSGDLVATGNQVDYLDLGNGKKMSISDFIKNSGDMVSVSDVVSALNDAKVEGANRKVYSQYKKEVMELETVEAIKNAKINAQANASAGVNPSGAGGGSGSGAGGAGGG